MVTSLLLRIPNSASPSTSRTSEIETPDASVPVSSLPNHSFAHLLRDTVSGWVVACCSCWSGKQHRLRAEAYGSTPFVRQCQFLMPALAILSFSGEVGGQEV